MFVYLIIYIIFKTSSKLIWIFKYPNFHVYDEDWYKTVTVVLITWPLEFFLRYNCCKCWTICTSDQYIQLLRCSFSFLRLPRLLSRVNIITFFKIIVLIYSFLIIIYLIFIYLWKCLYWSVCLFLKIIDKININHLKQIVES